MPYGNKPGPGGGYCGSGRGSGRTNGHSSGSRSGRGSSGNNKEQQGEMKFCPFQEGRKQVTYHSMKEHIYGIIKKNYKYGIDSVMFLHTGNRDQCETKPVQVITDLNNASGNDKTEFTLKVEQDGLDIDYANQLKEYNGQKHQLDQNLLKASELIMSHCHKIMQTRLKAILDFLR